MRTAKPPNGRNARSSHVAVREALIKEIGHGKLQRGEPLPSIREISKAQRVSKAIAERAVRSLVEEGICYAEQGRGVFLAVDGPDELDRLTQTATVGAIFGYLEYPRTDHVFYRQVYEGTQEWISGRHFNVLRLYSWRAKGPVQKSRELAQFADRLAGLVALGVYSDADCTLMRNTGLPLVVLDYDTESLGIDCAVLDNFETMYRLGRRVMAEEPGEVFLIGMERRTYDDPTSLERRAALEKAMAESGRSFPEENWLRLPISLGKKDRARLKTVRAAARSGGPRPLGLKAEKDYLLAYTGAAELSPQLERIPALVGASDYRKLGRAGAELLGERMKKGPGRPVKVAVPGEIVDLRPHSEGNP